MAKVEMYLKPTCPYCVRAGALLDEKVGDYSKIDIAQHPELRDGMIERANGAYTVPQIFINNQHIGGCDDLMALHASGQLDALLQ